MFAKILSFFVFFLFSFNSWSLSFDWSGWTRVEGYYQNQPGHNYYGNYHFVLQPEIYVIDGLSVTGRLDLSSLAEPHFSSSSAERQTGFVFLYAENATQKKSASSRLFLRPSQIYIDYQDEFFKLRLGRAPYHFGMGITYSASEDPFQHWISAYNQAALHFEYAPFYLQPVFLHNEFSKSAGVLQLGILNEEWKLEALYRHGFKNSSFVELFGHYEKRDWGVKSSFSYLFEKQTSLHASLEAFLQVAARIPFQLELKMGGAVGESLFHPNYNTALLFENRLLEKRESSSSQATSAKASDQASEAKSSPVAESGNQNSGEDPVFQIAEGQIQKSLYVSPRLLFSFFEDRLQVRPILLLARNLDKKQYSYELDLEGMYQFGESLFLSLKGGALYAEELQFALLTQAAVSF